MIQTIGYLAGLATIAIPIPQAYKSYKTKQTEDVSIASYTIYTLGVFLWIAYGWLDKDYPVFITSIFELIPVLVVILLKIKHDNK